MWQVVLGSCAVLVALGTWLVARAPRIWVTQVLEGATRFCVQNVGYGMAREVELLFDPAVPESGSTDDRSRFSFQDLPPGQKVFVFLRDSPTTVSNRRDPTVTVSWRGWLGWSSQYQFTMDLTGAENRYRHTVTYYLSQMNDTLTAFTERATRKMDDDDEDALWDSLIAWVVARCTEGTRMDICDYLDEVEEAARAKADEIRSRLVDGSCP